MLGELWQNHRAALLAAGAAIAVLSLSVVKVDETEQAVVLRFDKPVDTINRFNSKQDFGQTNAGIHFRVPFVERLVRIDRRMLTVDMERQQVLSTDQLRLEVDAFARFRVIDPIQMVKTAGTTDRVEEQLKPIFTSVLRQELGKRTFQSLLTAERGEAMRNIQIGLDRQAREYGAQVIDVRIKRADLPAGALESAYARMSAARNQEAATILAQGQKTAQIVWAEAQAGAAQTYANSFGKDPAFYDFYRAMQSYTSTFVDSKDKSESTLILSPDNDYLRQFKGN